MKIIKVKILDSTHLELSQPIAVEPGDYIVTSIPEESEEDEAWREMSRKYFLEAYDDQDTIYDPQGDHG
jgi:hypothetical protein